jgi:hypothetical protein
LLVLATGLIAYPVSFLVQMISVDSGHRIASAYASWIASAFSPGALPTIVPRLITLLLVIAVILAAVVGVRARRRGRWWPEVTGSPWTAEPGLRHVQGLLWQLFRGPTTVREPPPAEFSRRYAELLAENLGQPGFRELIIAAVDLETRSDLIFASLSGARRQPFFNRRGVSGELIDLAGAGRSHVLDALAGALMPPALCEPHAIAFSPESYWKGESHRITDRPAAVGRLMIELAAAGVEQVIVVSAVADRSAPHRLGKLGVTLEARLAEHLAAHEAAAVRDGIVAHSPRFSNVFLIQPAHNPVGPFDFSGSYDERSDRFQGVRELVDRGYQDGYRQFIEPVVGGEGGT